MPQIGVFGAAGGGTIINGALDVGKVVPHLSETTHITGVPTTRSAFTGTQLEAYTRQDDGDGHDFAGVITASETGAGLLFDDTGRPEPVLRGSNQMLFHIETFPAGTMFSTWIRLRRPSPLEMAFFLEVLDNFRDDGRLGGRVGIGHGQVRASLTADHDPPQDLPDWRTVVDQNRAEILNALQGLA